MDPNTPVTISLWHLMILGWIVSIALTAWWARKTVKHPEYAANFEATRIDPLLRRAGLDRLADVDLTSGGQTVYAQGNAKADELTAAARRLLEEAKALRDRAGGPPAPQ